MIVQWKNYEFDLYFDGTHWIAECCRSHKSKTRLCCGHWINGLNKRVQDHDFMDTMEARIRQQQHEMQPKVDTPPRQNMRGEGNRYE
jgi:hypothetical protein